MELIKLVDPNKKYVAKNGKEYESCAYYVKDGDTFVCVKPVFKGDYKKLEKLSTLKNRGE